MRRRGGGGRPAPNPDDPKQLSPAQYANKYELAGLQDAITFVVDRRPTDAIQALAGYFALKRADVDPNRELPSYHAVLASEEYRAEAVASLAAVHRRLSARSLRLSDKQIRAAVSVLLADFPANFQSGVLAIGSGREGGVSAGGSSDRSGFAFDLVLSAVQYVDSYSAFFGEVEALFSACDVLATGCVHEAVYDCVVEIYATRSTGVASALGDSGGTTASASQQALANAVATAMEPGAVCDVTYEEFVSGVYEVTPLVDLEPPL